MNKALITLAVTGAFLVGCGEQTTVENDAPKEVLNLDTVTVEFHPNKKPKGQELYLMTDGVKEIYGYQELYPSGALKMKGRFNADKIREGKWESFYEDGTPWSIGHFKDGVAEGLSVVWFEDGKKRYEGEMKGGKPVGEWKYYDSSGKETIKNY